MSQETSGHCVCFWQKTLGAKQPWAQLLRVEPCTGRSVAMRIPVGALRSGLALGGGWQQGEGKGCFSKLLSSEFSVPSPQEETSRTAQVQNPVAPPADTRHLPPAQAQPCLSSDRKLAEFPQHQPMLQPQRGVQQLTNDPTQSQRRPTSSALFPQLPPCRRQSLPLDTRLHF